MFAPLSGGFGEGMTEAKLFYATAPDEETASRIAEALVTEGVAACVNILPGMTSIYAWQNKIEKSAEVAMIVKSTAAKAADLVARFMTLHPYETPAIIALHVDAAHSSEAFLNWIAYSTGR